MNDYIYLVAPFLAWFIAGCIKFAINLIKNGKNSISLIGYGGLPSNHSAIVTCITTLIILKETVFSPLSGICITFSFIVIIDAVSLRREVGSHAKYINLLTSKLSDYVYKSNLRERVGHTLVEVFSGIIVGSITGWLLYNGL